MASELRLHIGPVKTGSTTIQTVLAGQREELALRGVLYPSPQNHSAVITPQWPRWVPGARRWGPLPAGTKRRYDAAWPRFLKMITEHPGPVAISSELLSCMPPAGVTQFLSELPEVPRLVLVDRPVSRQIPSWHQESVKRWYTPGFEEHARAMLASLFDPGWTEYDFLNADKLARQWRERGIDVTAVSAYPELSAEVLREVLDFLAPELEEPVLGRPANQSMSAFGVRVWREHMLASPPRLAAVGLAVLKRMLATFPRTSDPALGGRLALRPEVGELADAYAAGSAAAGRQLRQRLALAVPVTQAAGEGDAQEIRAALRRWQRREDVKWQMLAAGSQLAGKGRLTPGMWTPES